MISMKLSEKDREKEYPKTLAADQPKYPYGLTLHLDDTTMSKLGFKTPDLNATFTVEAKATVTSVSSSKSSEGHNHRSVSLQITAMKISKAGAEKSPVGALYGDD